MGREQQQVSYTVKQLVSVNPYNPDILSDLENYVNEQVIHSWSCLWCCGRRDRGRPLKSILETVSSQTYSLDANLCLLRLYQALMAMPASDFSLCLFLIPEQVQMQEQFKTLIVLSHYLEVCLPFAYYNDSNKVFHIDLYRPYRVVRTGPLGYRYADHPLLGGTAKIDHRRSIEGEKGKKKKKRKRRQKKEEEKKKEFLVPSSPVRRRSRAAAALARKPSPPSLAIFLPRGEKDRGECVPLGTGTSIICWYTGTEW
ncbi:hypothetical protein BHM03_00040475 [Ensete ventricosum]|nr:hypothetical protein BHM03_00040475 [Ensete ventricosum]